MLDKLPPQVDEENVPGSLARMYEYLFYLREKTQYEIDMINKRLDTASVGIGATSSPQGEG